MWPLFLLLTGARAGDGDCAAWAFPEATGALEPVELAEASGLAASAAAPGAYWSHNDGGSATIFGLAQDGAALGRYAVLGAQHEDWEDIAVGPCGAADPCSCIYVADIGDNLATRAEIAVYRFPEPAPGIGGGQTAPVEAFTFTYAAGPRDAETLLVDPRDGSVWLVTKQVDPLVFHLPLTEPGPVVIEAFGRVDAGAAADTRFSAGDVSPGGRRIALRSDDDLLIYTLGTGQSVGEALMGPPAALLAPSEPGEALTFRPDGQALVTTGEGLGATVWALECTSFSADEAAPELCPEAVAEPTGCGCASSTPVGWAWLVALAWLAHRRTTTGSSGAISPPVS